MAHQEELHDEQRRIRKLRMLVDLTAQMISEDENITLCEALRLVEAARNAAARLFPDNHTTFDLVIRPRLDRIVLERFGITSGHPTN